MTPRKLPVRAMPEAESVDRNMRRGEVLSAFIMSSGDGFVRGGVDFDGDCDEDFKSLPMDSTGGVGIVISFAVLVLVGVLVEGVDEDSCASSWDMFRYSLSERIPVLHLEIKLLVFVDDFKKPPIGLFMCLCKCDLAANE